MLRRTLLTGSALAAALATFRPLRPAGAQGKSLVILTSLPSLSFPFFVHMQKQLRAEADKLGSIKLVEQDGQNSATKQTGDVEAAITQKVDAIVISPLDVSSLAPAVQEAVDAKVPVVTIDRRINGVPGVLAHVGADNVKGGEAQGVQIVADFPNGGRVFHLQGQPGAGPAIDRNKGLHSVLDAHKDKFEIIFQQTANFARDQALSVTESGLAGLAKPPDIIVCANDDMALGALEAVRARNLKGIKIYGFDALPEALARVKDGSLAGTVEQFPGQQSRIAMDIAVAFARDGKQPENKLVLITPIVITKDNLNRAERISEMT
ncbi:MAG TPA: substrate-binding domain-containing protein [Acetobacteraceae bacterium]|nr:substrate-binding domain-containing protein [Acetobacteraceae bacterium]